jgi:GcrA cell cycle regulator
MIKWTPHLDRKIKEFADSKRSARALADEIGVTRNAVIGRARRIGVSFKSVGVPQRKRTFFKHIVKKVVEIVIPPQKPKPTLDDKKFVTLMELNGRTCRWPVAGEREKTLFCGQRPVKGKPYCEGHYAIAYCPRSSK